MSVLTVLKKIITGIGHLFSKDAIDKALSIAQAIEPLIALALPVSEALARSTPNTVDDLIVGLAQKMGRTLQEILDEPDPDVRRGLLQGIVKRGIIQALQRQIVTHGEVKIGPFTLKSVTDIFNLLPGNWLDQAVQSAFTFFVKAK